MKSLQAKLKEVAEAEDKAIDRLKQRYKKLDDSMTLIPKKKFLFFWHNRFPFLLCQYLPVVGLYRETE